MIEFVGDSVWRVTNIIASFILIGAILDLDEKTIAQIQIDDNGSYQNPELELYEGGYYPNAGYCT